MSQLRRYNLTAPQRETKFTIGDLKIYDREDNEIVVDVEFSYNWSDRSIVNLTLTEVASKKEVVWYLGERFYGCQIDSLFHECHEHVANRTENINF